MSSVPPPISLRVFHHLLFPSFLSHVVNRVTRVSLVIFGAPMCKKLQAISWDMYVICLQQSKLQEISTFKASSFIPPNLRKFYYILSDGASVGIIMTWNNNDFSCVDYLIYPLLTNPSVLLLNQWPRFCHYEHLWVMHSWGKINFLDSLQKVLPFVNGPLSIIGDLTIQYAHWTNLPTISVLVKQPSSLMFSTP